MKKLISVSIFIMLFAMLAQSKAPAKKSKPAAKKVEAAAFVPTVQGPGIVFASQSYDFGKIKEEDGSVTTTFEFTNNGSEPLILSEVRASCGCTTPDWTKEPVAPGAKGFVKATYNTKGRPGMFEKSITVKSNAAENGGTVVLTIKGEVIAAPPAQ